MIISKENIKLFYSLLTIVAMASSCSSLNEVYSIEDRGLRFKGYKLYTNCCGYTNWQTSYKNSNLIEEYITIYRITNDSIYGGKTISYFNKKRRVVKEEYYNFITAPKNDVDSDFISLGKGDSITFFEMPQVLDLQLFGETLSQAEYNTKLKSIIGFRLAGSKLLQKREGRKVSKSEMVY